MWQHDVQNDAAIVSSVCIIQMFGSLLFGVQLSRVVMSVWSAEPNAVHIFEV